MADINTAETADYLIDKLYDAMGKHLTKEQYYALKSGALDRINNKLCRDKNILEIDSYHKDVFRIFGAIQGRELITFKDERTYVLTHEITKKQVEYFEENDESFQLWNPDKDFYSQFKIDFKSLADPNRSIMGDLKIAKKQAREDVGELDTYSALIKKLNETEPVLNPRERNSLMGRLGLYLNKRYLMFLMKVSSDEKYLKLGDKLLQLLELESDKKQVKEEVLKTKNSLDDRLSKLEKRTEENNKKILEHEKTIEERIKEIKEKALNSYANPLDFSFAYEMDKLYKTYDSKDINSIWDDIEAEKYSLKINKDVKRKHEKALSSAKLAVTDAILDKGVPMFTMADVFEHIEKAEKERNKNENRN